MHLPALLFYLTHGNNIQSFRSNMFMEAQQEMSHGKVRSKFASHSIFVHIVLAVSTRGFHIFLAESTRGFHILLSVVPIA